MRKLETMAHKTFLTSNIRLGDPKMFQERGFATAELHDKKVLTLLSSVQEGASLVVLGNLFHSSASEQTIRDTIAVMKTRRISLLCAEGNQDHKLLWKLRKEGALDLIGDMAILESTVGNFVCSFYPMVEWPQKKHGNIHVFGMETELPPKSIVASNGGMCVSMNSLVLKMNKPMVSLQHLSEMSKQETK